MERLPLIWAVVLNFNGREMTRQCLQTLLASTYPNLKILLVDNASVDHTAETVQADFPQVSILQNPKNYLFAKGNNAGIAYALNHGAEYIFILNNDTLVAPECIRTLASFLHGSPGCAACQPLLLQMGRPERVASAGCRVALSGRATDMHYGVSVQSVPSHPFRVCGVTGGAFLVRSKALDHVGYFCEYFKMYFEDVDLSLRLQAEGYTLYCVPAGRVWHYVSASTKKRGTFFYTYYTERNSYLVVLRNYPLLQVLHSYLFKVPVSGVNFGLNLLKGNFAYSLAILFSMGWGLLAMAIWLPARIWAGLCGKKKRYPFWPGIEKNTLYP